MNDSQNAGAQQARDIPTPPGGGSWTFDEAKWEWVSNDPVPEPEQAVPAVAGADQFADGNQE